MTAIQPVVLEMKDLEENFVFQNPGTEILRQNNETEHPSFTSGFPFCALLENFHIKHYQNQIEKVIQEKKRH